MIVNSSTELRSLDYQDVSLGVDALSIRITGYGNSDSSWNSITAVRFNGVDPVYEPLESSDEPSSPEEPPADPDDLLLSRDVTSLRGDPSFSRDQLPVDQRALYDRFRQELDDPSSLDYVHSLIDRDDNFFYGRMIHTHIQSVLTVFRLTGDLELLDYVDDLTERMRENLDYGWRDTRDGTDGEWDEYLMWVYRSSAASGSSDSNDGKDIKINDVKVAALIAMVAYALDENRDLESPSGKDYGAHADFWRYYLVDHYEAKWRDRSNKPSGHPVTRPHSDAHSWWSWIKGSYFIGKLTGDEGWLEEANRAANVVWDHEIRDVADYGESFSAYVWMSNIHWQSDRRNYLQTTSYANSNYGDAVTFYFEGFHTWADPEVMESFARGIVEFHFRRADGSRYSSPSDILSHGIAGDIGGNSPEYKVVRAGIPPDDRDNRPVRRTARVFSGYQSSLLGAWDDSGEIIAVGAAYQDANPSEDTMHIAAAQFMNAWYRADDR